jgi:photoactive yellow protein
MPAVFVNFDAPDLAAQIEKLSAGEVDQLQFGVVRLDRDGIVDLYSATEARLSGYGTSPLGQNFFEISRCAGRGDFQARVVKAQEEGPVDLEFAFPGDYANPTRELRVRVQSARNGGVWLFMERD